MKFCLCPLWMNRISTSHSPLALLKLNSAFLQSKMFWGLPSQCRTLDWGARCGAQILHSFRRTSAILIILYAASLPLLPISLWFFYSFSFRRSFLWVSRSFSSIVALWIVVIFVWEEVNLGFSYSVILATLLTTLSFITLLVVNLEKYNMHSWLKPTCN